MKVAFLVPTTTNKRDWKSINESYLWTVLMNHLENKTPVNCEIKLFIGYDEDDKVLSNIEERMKANAIFKRFQIEWFPFNEDYKGKPTHIWNELATIAFRDGYEYVKVLGDDITLPNDTAWLTCMIKKLKKNNNVGWCAGWSNNNAIATQFLLHKTHVEIFGWIYPPQIYAWFCDDFLNLIYPEKFKIWLKHYKLLNIGGEPRYTPTDDKKLCYMLIKRHKPQLNRYLSQKD